MYQRVNETDFIDAFRAFGRLNTPDSDGGNFTPAALRALFAWLEEYEDSVREPVGPGMELDVIAICCDFAEFDSVEELAHEYGYDDDVTAMLIELDGADSTDADPDDVRERLLDYFRDQTAVIEIPGTDRIVIQSF